MSDGYAVQVDWVRNKHLVQEIEANLQDIKECFDNLEHLTTLVNRQQKLAIPDDFEPFIQKYFEIPEEKREIYLTCFSGEEQEKIREYVALKENELTLPSFEEEVDKTAEFINILMHRCKELQKCLPSIQQKTNKPRSKTSPSIAGHEEMAYAKIGSFTFKGQTYHVRNWTEYLLQICSFMYQRHPERFSQIASLTRPRGGVFFSKDPEACIRALPVSDSGIYVEANMSATKIYKRSFDIIQFFGYESEDLEIQYQ
ncbi:MAG TPA: hypothetical protein PLK04_07650 [Bacillota bacterium]|jgi:hypothetical protein|nr:hypothetical protein [Bacillota bacterium]HPZ14096.1 hypothetical protein [Bacillota bacterium]